MQARRVGAGRGGAQAGRERAWDLFGIGCNLRLGCLARACASASALVPRLDPRAAPFVRPFGVAALRRRNHHNVGLNSHPGPACLPRRRRRRPCLLSPPHLLPSSTSPPPRTPSHTPYGDERKGIHPAARLPPLSASPLPLHLLAINSSSFPRPAAHSTCDAHSHARSFLPPFSKPLDGPYSAFLVPFRSGPTEQLTRPATWTSPPHVPRRAAPSKAHADNNAIRPARGTSLFRSPLLLRHNKHWQGRDRISHHHQSYPHHTSLDFSIPLVFPRWKTSSQQVEIASGVRG